jgi:hypothetical protein
MLPVSAQALQSQPGRWASPPFVPQNLNVPNSVFHLLPTIATVIANDISEKSTVSSLRTFLYNLISSNQWANQFYAELIQWSAWVLELNCRKGIYPNPESGIEDAVLNTVSMYASNKIFEFPELKSYIPPQMIDAAMGNLNCWQSIQNEIIALQTQNGMMGQMNQMGQMMPANQFQNNGFYGRGGQVPQQNNQAIRRGGNYFGNGNLTYQPPPNYMVANNSPTTVPTSAQLDRYGKQPNNYQRPQQTTFGQDSQQQQQNKFLRNKRYGDSESVVEQSAQPDKESTPLAPAVPEVLTAAHWKPSQYQLFKTVYDQSRYEPHYNLVSGAVVELIEPLGDMMDREKHRTGIIGNNFTLPVTRMNAVAQDSQVLDSIGYEDFGTQDEAIQKQIKEVIRETLTLESNLDSAILDARFARQAAVKDNGELPMVYRCFALVTNPILTQENYRSVLDSLSSMQSFGEMAMRLNSLARAVKEKDLIDMALFIEQVNQYLTDVINNFLRKNAGLTLSVTSFIEDMPGLREYLQKSKGIVYAEALDRFEKDVIKLIVTPLAEEEEFMMNEQLIDEADKVCLTYLPIGYSLTFVNVLEKELNLALKEGEVKLIRESISPEVYAIANSAFGQKNAFPSISRNLMITLDNKIFELYKGYVGTENNAIKAFLISRY